jgi:putative membrane protein
LLIGGGVLLVVWLIRNAKISAPTTRSDSALDILKSRYAKGEITREQFDAIKRDLGV